MNTLGGGSRADRGGDRDDYTESKGQQHLA
jgi:hypothetical protein